jgi:hypothetical protein
MIFRPPLIDLWPFPEIPGPKDWIAGLAHMLADAQTFFMKTSMYMLLHYATPSLKVIQSDWFAYIQGQWLSLAINLMSFVIVIVHLLILLRPSADHVKSLTKTYMSMIIVALEVRLFYPVYGLLAWGSTQASDGIIKLMTDQTDKDSLLDEIIKITSFTNVLALFGSSLVGIVVQFFVMITCVGIFIWTLVTLVYWPISVALRPISKLTEKLYHFANGILAMAFIAPPVMIFWLCTVVWSTHVDGNFMPGNEGLVAFFMELIASFMVIVTPFAIVFGAYKVSSEVTGKIESTVQGSVNVSASEPLTVREAADSNREDRSSFLKEAGTAALVATIDDKEGEPISRRLADIAATAATASGHPEVAIGFELVKRSISDQPKKGDDA